FSNALTLIQVSRLAKQAEYRSAHDVVKVQAANLEMVRRLDQNPELTKEAQSLAKVQAQLKELAEGQEAADARNQVVAEEKNPLLKDAMDVAARALPGPWSVVFGLLRWAME
ncbi:MAG TPA: hypothetical protein VM598_06100, partial [Bdellovibrionota bacterium]|nr:hypothetical protein [Bdellovibrionota bacterium]